MAVSFLDSHESHSGTTGSASEASFTFSASPIIEPQGILVFTFVNANADDATAVSWGGLSLTAVTGGRAVDTANEDGDCKAWFRGSGLTGRSTDDLTVTRNNTANVMYALAIFVNALGNTEVYGTPVLLQENGTCAEQSIDDATPGRDSVRFAAINSGLGSVSTTTPASNTCAPGASSTHVESIDFGARVIQIVRETTAGQGARSVGFSNATSDDLAAVHLVVRDMGVPRRVMLVS